MNAHLSTPAAGRMTVEQFLDWAQAQVKGRYELVDGVPVKMSPERNQHALVKGAVYRALAAAVEAARIDCVVFPDGPMVVIDQDRSRGPDVVVHIGPAFDPNALTVERPVILVEVTSPTTMRTDTDDKLIEYAPLSPPLRARAPRPPGDCASSPSPGERHRHANRLPGDTQVRTSRIRGRHRSVLFGSPAREGELMSGSAPFGLLRCRGHMLADVSAVLGSLDIVFGEVDR